MKQPGLWRVFRVVGVRPALAFGVMTAVVVFLLATLQVSSRHALKDYLEASGRVVVSESEQARVRFGLWQLLALLVGAGKVIGWIGGWSLARAGSAEWLRQLDRGAGFRGLSVVCVR